MKKYIVAFATLFCLTSHKMFGQTSDPLTNQILAVGESQYIGKPLDSLINALPSGYLQMKIVADGRSRITARKLRIIYPNQVWIDLHVKEYANMNPVDENRIWSVTLMRKEKLYITVVYKHINCYRNCDVR
jgi:hypothetical protein